MFTKAARRGIPAIALVAAGLALAACGPDDSSSSKSSDSGDSSSAASNGGGASAGKSGGGSGSAGGSSTSGGQGKDDASGDQDTAGSTVPACATADLKTTVSDTSAGAGHVTFQIVFQNTGSGTCTLSGYPGVSFTKADGDQLGKAAARTTGTKLPVTLIPNAHAYAEAQTVDGQGGYSADECDLTAVPKLKVYPPNQTASVDVDWGTGECVGPTVQNLHVGPVHGTR
jgi:Protein of unknown function (DUF4232)